MFYSYKACTSLFLGVHKEMEWNDHQRNRMEWNGMEWNEFSRERNGIKKSCLDELK